MNRKGVTLAELIIVVAIVGVIATVTANIFIFGNKSFDRSQDISSQQMDTRLVIQAISKELRYAEDIRLLKDKDSIPQNSSIKDEDKYIYFDYISKKIMKKDGKNSAYEFLSGEQNFENLYFDIQNTEGPTGGEEVRLKLFIKEQHESSNADGEPDVKTTISLLNQKTTKDDGASKYELNETNDTKFNVIKYKK